MRTIPPAQAEHQLTQVANCFEEWRQTRTTRAEPIPQHLWEQAIALTQLPRSKPCFGSIKARKSYKCLIFHEELWPCI
jgi:hypothetical protein